MTTKPKFTNILNNTLYYGMIGFGVFGAVGAAKTFFGQSNTLTSQQQFDLQNYPNVQLDQLVVEALHKIEPFGKHAAEELRIIKDCFNKLIGLQIEINRQNIQAIYPYRATLYCTSIENALRKMEFFIRNIVTPHFETDKTAIINLANDYKYNITQDTNNFLISNRSQN